MIFSSFKFLYMKYRSRGRRGRSRGRRGRSRSRSVGYYVSRGGVRM